MHGAAMGFKMRSMATNRCSFLLAGAALAAASLAHAAYEDTPAPLRDAARAQGNATTLRVYCKRDGRTVAHMRIDLKAGTINGSTYRVEGNTIRWSARNAPAGAPAPERVLQTDGLEYTGPTLGGGVDTYQCEPSNELPRGIIYTP